MGLQAAKNLILDSAFKQLAKNGNFKSWEFGGFCRLLKESSVLFN